MTDEAVGIIIAMLLVFYAIGRCWLAVAGGRHASSRPGGSSAVALRRSGTVARPGGPAAAPPASKAASRPASSAAAVAGGFGRAVLWVIWVAMVLGMVVLPIGAWIKTGEPICVIAPWAAAAWCWWAERREQCRWLKRHGKPRPENYPAGATYRERW